MTASAPAVERATGPAAGVAARGVPRVSANLDRDGDVRGCGGGSPTGEPLLASDEAARRTGSSPRSVQRAKRIKDADPALHEQVKAGRITVGTAEKRIAKSPAEEAVYNLWDETGKTAKRGLATGNFTAHVGGLVRTYDLSGEKLRGEHADRRRIRRQRR